MKTLILASGSPRRKQLLEQAQLSFTISTSSIDENLDETSPQKLVETLAFEKANDVFTTEPQSQKETSVVLGADTIVSINGTILGKPKDAREAKQMLRMLSNNVHQVYTGVAIISNERTTVFHEKTNVHFWELTDEEIDRYIQSGQPFDKAGSYGIQEDLGSLFVKKIDGDYFTVVGLPIARTVRELKSFHIVNS